MKSIDNSQDSIDSRDVILRIAYLENDREILSEALEEASVPAHKQSRLEAYRDAKKELEDWDEENSEELKNLNALAKEAEGYRDWEHGATLICESYFEDYARELAKDIGAITGDESWPATCIDWEQAAKELQMDYTSVEFDDVTYYMR
jgi:hypothetical protein